jgi:hypothetical protein
MDIFQPSPDPNVVRVVNSDPTQYYACGNVCTIFTVFQTTNFPRSLVRTPTLSPWFNWTNICCVFIIFVCHTIGISNEKKVAAHEVIFAYDMVNEWRLTILCKLLVTIQSQTAALHPV